MDTKRLRWKRGLRSWCGAGVLAVWTLWSSASLAGAPVRPYQITIFTIGLAEQLVVEGLREGLAQLGYVEGKNITLLVADTHGVPPDLVRRAARLVAAHPDVLVTIGTIHTTAAHQATDRLPIVFT